MPVRICCISSEPNCVANFHSNLDDLTIVRASKRISVPSSFLWFWIVVGIFVLFFLIVRVTSCRLLNIPPREVLPTVYFLVGLCALLGDVEVSFSAYMLHIVCVEASFEVLGVNSFEERSIGVPIALASAPTRPSPSTAIASSTAFNLWDPSPAAPASLVLVAFCNYKDFSNLGCHMGNIANPITNLVIFDFGIGQHNGHVILNLNPINQSLQYCLLCDLVLILFDYRKCCFQACSIFCKREYVLVILEQTLLWLQRDSLII